MKHFRNFINESLNNSNSLVKKILSSFDLEGCQDKEIINAIKKWVKDNNITDIIPAARKKELDSWRFVDEIDKNLYNNLIKNEKLLDKYNFKDLKIIYQDGDIEEFIANDDQDSIEFTICCGKDWISWSEETIEDDFLQIYCLKQ